MSFAKIYTRGPIRPACPLIEVEVHLSHGLPSLTIVGLASGRARKQRPGQVGDYQQRLPVSHQAPDHQPCAGRPAQRRFKAGLAHSLGILIASGQLPGAGGGTAGIHWRTGAGWAFAPSQRHAEHCNCLPARAASADPARAECAGSRC